MTLLWAVNLVVAAVSLLSAQPQQKATSGSLTVDDVVRFSKEGFSDEWIIERVRGNAKAFDLNADEVLWLRKAGLSETVIKYLFNPGLPYSPPPPPPKAVPSIAPSPPKSSDPLALKIPPESGIYYLAGKEEFLRLDFKAVVPAKQPGRLPSVLSAGLIKGHIVGSVIGAAANTRVALRPATFYARLGEKMVIEDLALLSLKRSGSRRDLDFGTKPGNPAFPVNSVRPFASKEVSPGLFRLVIPLKQPGEFLFFILGSGDEKKGLLGKGYDFGVD